MHAGGPAIQLVVIEEDAIAAGVIDDGAIPHGVFGAARIHGAVVFIVLVVKFPLPGQIGQIFGWGSGDVEQIVIEVDALGGVKIGGPGERVVVPIIAQNSGHGHGGIAERPHGLAVDEGAEGTVATIDDGILLNRTQRGDRDYGWKRRHATLGGCGEGCEQGDGGEEIRFSCGHGR